MGAVRRVPSHVCCLAGAIPCVLSGGCSCCGKLRMQAGSERGVPLCMYCSSMVSPQVAALAVAVQPVAWAATSGMDAEHAHLVPQ
jgi:hypothetical protein